MIYKENSDITKVSSGCIAHGVNCQGVMGSGVAKALYTKWPRVRTEYFNIKFHHLGTVQSVKIDKNLSIFNCHTQEFYGQLTNKVYADLLSIKLRGNLLSCTDNDIRLYEISRKCIKKDKFDDCIKYEVIGEVV